MKRPDRPQAESDLFETAETAPNSTTRITFRGTTNPRFLRALHVLRVRPVPREQLDRIVGCSNGPALVSELRDLGLGKEGLACTMVPDRDRDGCPVRRGVYHLTDGGRCAVNAWLRKRKGGAR